MSKPTKFLKLDKAIELLHHRESRLVRMHSAGGRRWFVLHRRGGPVSDADAIKIIARPDIRGDRDSPFPNLSQTFRMMR
jgi:hypothetical protein